uniref:sensor histidine kinase n=1 Tax=Marivirga sericea TaxID=1028 RepID=UPI00373FD79B
MQLNTEINELKKLFDSLLKSKGISLNITMPKYHHISADKETMQIVLRNLISNAIKFTPHGGQITISARTNPKKSTELSISDSGIGIPSEKIDQLFVINRDHLIGTSSATGAGIGLLLVKEFVELNNGKVSVESSVGKGTTFKVVLPIT